MFRRRKLTKSSTEGLKLYSGGKEATPEQIKRTIEENRKLHNSAEYKAEAALLFEFMQKPRQKSIQYYRLLFEPFTVFKTDREHFLSYKLDSERECWLEAAWFFAELERGEVRVEEIDFEDVYPVFGGENQNNRF